MGFFKKKASENNDAKVDDLPPPSPEDRVDLESPFEKFEAEEPSVEKEETSPTTMNRFSAISTTIDEDLQQTVENVGTLGDAEDSDEDSVTHVENIEEETESQSDYDFAAANKAFFEEYLNNIEGTVENAVVPEVEEDVEEQEEVFKSLDTVTETDVSNEGKNDNDQDDDTEVVVLDSGYTSWDEDKKEPADVDYISYEYFEAMNNNVPEFFDQTFENIDEDTVTVEDADPSVNEPEEDSENLSETVENIDEGFSNIVKITLRPSSVVRDEFYVPQHLKEDDEEPDSVSDTASFENLLSNDDDFTFGDTDSDEDEFFEGFNNFSETLPEDDDVDDSRSVDETTVDLINSVEEEFNGESEIDDENFADNDEVDEWVSEYLETINSAPEIDDEVYEKFVEQGVDEDVPEEVETPDPDSIVDLPPPPGLEGESVVDDAPLEGFLSDEEDALGEADTAALETPENANEPAENAQEEDNAQASSEDPQEFFEKLVKDAWGNIETVDDDDLDDEEDQGVEVESVVEKKTVSRPPQPVGKMEKVLDVNDLNPWLDEPLPFDLSDETDLNEYLDVEPEEELYEKMESYEESDTDKDIPKWAKESKMKRKLPLILFLVFGIVFVIVILLMIKYGVDNDYITRNPGTIEIMGITFN